MKKLLIVGLLVPLAFASCARDTTYDELAQCITDSGAEYFGAYWCSNCQKQSLLFGDSKDLIPYIECDESGKDEQAEYCLTEGIEAYPTWRFADGSEMLGLQSLETLSEKTHCPLPGEEQSVMYQ